MPDRKGRPGLLGPKHGDAVSFMLTSQPDESEDGEGDE